MKTITVQNPWAWAIIHGGKNVENRTSLAHWQHLAGERIAIHAGLRWSDRGAADWRIHEAYQRVEHLPTRIIPNQYDPPFIYGAIIGTVHVLEVHIEEQCCDPWGDERDLEHSGMSRSNIVHLELTAPRPCPPIPARGALGAWHLPNHIRNELEAATSR